jgi:hypothetical protein
VVSGLAAKSVEAGRRHGKRQGDGAPSPQIERRPGTRHTADTLSKLAMRFPSYRFVWLMGADNLARHDIQWKPNVRVRTLGSAKAPPRKLQCNRIWHVNAEK